MKLIGTILSTYKLKILVSITLSIVLIALRVEKAPINIIAACVGALLGTFMLELEYIIAAYWTDPDSEFSPNFRELISQGNYATAIIYARKHGYSLKQRTLHSVLFQLVLAFLLYYLVTSFASLLSIALVLSIYIQTFYAMYEENDETHSIVSWFWILKKQPSKGTQILYLLAMVAVLVYIFSQI